MKTRLLLLAILLSATASSGQVITAPGGTANRLNGSTVAALPAAGVINRVRIVTDSLTVGDCTVGGGAERTLCRDTGLVWQSLGDGGGGAGGDSITVNTTAVVDPDFITTATVSVTENLVPTPDTISWAVVANSIGTAQVDETAAFVFSALGNTTISAMTAGSMIFAGTGGILSQDNANLFYEDGSNELGIGTNSPQRLLHVSGSGTLARLESSLATTHAEVELYAPNLNLNTAQVTLGYNTNDSLAALKQFARIGLLVTDRTAGSEDAEIHGSWYVAGGLAVSLFRWHSNSILDLVSSAGGIQIAGAAASGNYLRGNGTSFVSSAIQPADLGSAYIDATTDFLSTLCGTNQILEDQGASWACINTPTSGTAAWEALVNTADTATSYLSTNTAEIMTFSFESAFGASQQFLIRQQTGNPTAGTLLDVRAADAQVTVFRAGDGTNGITVSQVGALTAEGTGAITATLGDTATAFFSAGTLEDARLSTNVALYNNGSKTWGAAAGFNWTFDAGATDPVFEFTSGNVKMSGATTYTFEGGATDPVWTPGNSIMNLSTGTLQQGGTAVVLQTRTITGGAGVAAMGDLSADRTVTVGAGTCITVNADDVAVTAACISSTQLATANKQLTKSISILDPTTALTNKAQLYWHAAVTLQEVTCSTLPAASTVTIQLDERAEATPNTAGVDSLTAVLVCDDNSQTTTAFADSAIAAEVPHNLQITAVAGTPTAVRIHIRAAIN